MPTIFTKIIDGDLPGHFVWKDDVCVVFLSIAPLKPGHLLVVPRAEVDHWLDLDPDVNAHLTRVAQKVGHALMQAFEPARVATLVLGMEVPHVHVHVVPIERESDVHFANAKPNTSQADLAAAATKVRDALRALGHAEVAE
jgi:histidine triad (HIT) family protein